MGPYVLVYDSAKLQALQSTNRIKDTFFKERGKWRISHHCVLVGPLTPFERLSRVAPVLTGVITERCVAISEAFLYRHSERWRYQSL